MAESPHARPVPVAHYLTALVALTSMQVISTLAFNVAPLLAPEAAGDLGIVADDLAYYVSGGYLFCVVAAVTGGTIAARLGAIRFSQTCLVVLAAGVLCLASGLLPLAIVATILVGLGTGPMTVASSQILSRVTPPSLSNITFSIKQSGVPIGFAAGGVLVPWLAVTQGWQWAAIAVAALCLGMALAIQPLRRLYDHPSMTRGGRILPRLHEITEPLKFVWRDPVLRPLSLAAMVFSATQVTVVNFLVLYGINRLGLDYILAGTILAAATVSGAVGRVAWGALADLLRRPLLVLSVIGALMSLASYTMALATHHWDRWLLYGAAVLLGGTAVGWNGVFLSLQARRAPPGRAGEITGATSLFVFGGPLLWPLIYRGLLYMTESYAVGFAAVGTLVLGSVALVARQAWGERR